MQEINFLIYLLLYVKVWKIFFQIKVSYLISYLLGPFIIQEMTAIIHSSGVNFMHRSHTIKPHYDELKKAMKLPCFNQFSY